MARTLLLADSAIPFTNIHDRGGQRTGEEGKHSRGVIEHNEESRLPLAGRKRDPDQEAGKTRPQENSSNFENRENEIQMQCVSNTSPREVQTEIEAEAATPAPHSLLLSLTWKQKGNPYQKEGTSHLITQDTSVQVERYSYHHQDSSSSLWSGHENARMTSLSRSYSHTNKQTQTQAANL